LADVPGAVVVGDVDVVAGRAVVAGVVPEVAGAVVAVTPVFTPDWLLLSQAVAAAAKTNNPTAGTSTSFAFTDLPTLGQWAWFRWHSAFAGIAERPPRLQRR
jgi:hypothetical protein